MACLVPLDGAHPLSLMAQLSPAGQRDSLNGPICMSRKRRSDHDVRILHATTLRWIIGLTAQPGQANERVHEPEACTAELKLDTAHQDSSRYNWSNPVVDLARGRLSAPSRRI